jgi:DNA topoisomerase-1
MSGRYGPYVKFGKINATLPRDKDPQAVTLDDAVALIAEREGKTPSKKKPAAKKAGAARKSAKAEKPAPAKKAARKAPRKPKAA